MVTERGQPGRPELLIVRSPVHEFFKRLWRERVDPVAPLSLLGNQPDFAEQLEMLRDRGCGHLEALRQLMDGHGANAQFVEDLPPAGVSDGAEDVRFYRVAGHIRIRPSVYLRRFLSVNE